jgi:hypothetical protein
MRTRDNYRRAVEKRTYCLDMGNFKSCDKSLSMAVKFYRR